MSYEELVNLVEEDKKFFQTRMDVVAYLISYQKKLDVRDYENVMRLYIDGFID